MLLDFLSNGMFSNCVNFHFPKWDFTHVEEQQMGFWNFVGLWWCDIQENPVNVSFPGKSSNIVDANMCVLRKRIEQQRLKERLLEKAWNNASRENGWNYKAGYNDKYKRRVLIAESFELAALVCRTIGLVFLSGSLFIFLYSLLLMHIQIHQSWNEIEIHSICPSLILPFFNFLVSCKCAGCCYWSKLRVLGWQVIPRT